MEKAKSALTTPVQVDRSALNRATDDKLVKVQSAIEVFTTEIQMIMNSLSENSESLSDADLGIAFNYVFCLYISQECEFFEREQIC